MHLDVRILPKEKCSSYNPLACHAHRQSNNNNNNNTTLFTEGNT